MRDPSKNQSQILPDILRRLTSKESPREDKIYEGKEHIRRTVRTTKGKEGKGYVSDGIKM